MISLILDPILRDYKFYEEDSIGISNDHTLYICKKIKDTLCNKNIKINLIRNDESFVSIEEKKRILRENKADLIISIEFSDLITVKNSEVEVYYNVYDNGIDFLAKLLSDSISSEIKINNKGIKKYHLYSTNEDVIPAIAIKFNICNGEFITQEINESIAQQVKINVEKYLNRNKIQGDEDFIQDNISNLTKILGISKVDKNQAKTWAKNKGATNDFIGLANIYWDMCKRCGGVNPVVAYAQAAYETAYGNFKGDLKEEFKNVCGFKNEFKVKGENKVSYVKFSNWADSVEAHLDHLALYAGAEGYPKEKTKDPKHLSYLYKMIDCAEDLSKNWSPKADYGTIISNLCKEIYKTTKIPGVEDIKIRRVNDVEQITSEQIENFKDKLKNVNIVLDNLKSYNNSLYDFLEKIQNYIDNVESEKNVLANNNNELNTQIDKSKQLVSNMKELLNLIVE